MAELTRDIANYLIGKALVTAIGMDLFLDTRPDSPDNLVSLTEYAGPPSQTGFNIQGRRIQVLVRATTYSAVRSKAWAIYKELDKAPARGEGIRLTDTRTCIIKALQTPFKLETDANNRVAFAFNLSIVSTRD